VPAGTTKRARLPQDRVVSHSLSRLLAGVPWALPGVLLVLVLATVLARPAARRLSVPTALAWLLVASLGAIAVITLTPSPDLPDMAGCDLTVTRITLGTLLSVNDRSLNVALFIPLGLAIGAVDGRRRAAWLLLAILLPLGIELYQLALTPLSRTCQAIDVLDNWTGLAIGFVVGSVVGWAWRRWSAPRG
jgi:hypothetical protein